jgi:hypothetical protein
MAKKQAVPDTAKNTTALEIVGKTYQLAYDFNMIVSSEREAGCNLLAGLTDLANLSGLQLRGLFLAAIRAADPASKMTITQAGELISFDQILPVVEALARSIVLSVPQKATEPIPTPEVTETGDPAE